MVRGSHERANASLQDLFAARVELSRLGCRRDGFRGPRQITPANEEPRVYSESVLLVGCCIEECFPSQDY